MKKTVAAAFSGVLTLWSAPVMAAPTVWACALSGGVQNGPLGDSIAFSHDETKGTATVSDPLILYVRGKPMAARVSVRSNGKTTFNWTVDSVPSDTRAGTSIRYRATLVAATGALSVSAQPIGFANSFFKKGACNRQG